MKTPRLAVLLAAAAVPLIVGEVAQAQYRIDTGRANDANNRVGSGGYNGGGRVYNPGAYGNDIVYGNVTGGREFRGNISSFNPYNFQAPTGANGIDRFVRDSSGTTTGGVTSYNADTVRPYYSGSQAIAPPPGYAKQPFVGGYVPQRLSAPTAADQRPDAATNFRLDSAVPTAGTYNLPGPADPDGNQSTIDPNAPPAEGGDFQLGAEGRGDRLNLRNLGGPDALSPYTTLYRQGPALSADDLKLPDGPLNQRPIDTNDTNEDARGAAVYGLPGRQGASDRNPPGAARDSNDQRTAQPADGLSDQRVGGGAINGRIQTGSRLDPLRGETGTDLNVRNVRQPQLVTPELQSSQYAALLDRLKRFQGGDQAADDGTIRPGITNRPINGSAAPGSTGQKAADAAQALTMPNRGGLTIPADAAPGAGQKSDPTATQAPPAVPNVSATAPPTAVRPQPTSPPQPVQIGSLGQGVEMAGLKNLFDKAEKQMKAGKYASAVDTYDTAEQVAPNNPLVLLGRANAELGSSYYRRAETHLRDAFTQDQALLMGQYDLKSMIGQDRLNLLVKELRDLAKNDPEQAGPVFLLAYIDYNTGDERRAAAYLDLASKRSPNDPFYAAVKKYWGGSGDSK